MRSTLIFFLCIIQISLISFFYEQVSVDKVNYINYADESSDILIYLLEGNLYQLLINEPVWLIINILLAYITDIEFVPLYIGLLSYLISVLFVIKKVDKKYIFIILLLFFMPQIYKSFLIHLRQGLGVSIYLMAFLVEKKRNKLFLIFFSGLIHNSFIPIFFVHAMYEFLLRKFSARSVIALSLIPIFIIAFYLFDILRALGFRQNNYYENVILNNSGIGFLFWFIIFIIFLLNRLTILRKNLICIIPLGVYLIFYFINPVASRLFESYIILIISSLIYLPKSKFFTTYGLLLAWATLNNFLVNY